MQNCRLVALQDLDTGSDYVRSEIAAYLNDLISLGVRGFRVDASKHIAAGDLEAIRGKLTDQSVYIEHEVIAGGGEPIQPAEYFGSGDSNEFNYSRNLKSVFQSGNLSSLGGLKDQSWLLPTDKAAVFVDNHDTERNGETLSYKNGSDYRLANVFALSYPYGWPTVYSGYAFSNNDAGAPQQGNGKVNDAVCGQGTWTCAHRWNETAHMVGFRNAVGTAALTNVWSDGGRLAYGRGSLGYVAINRNGSALQRTFQTSLPAGRYCDVISGATTSGGCSGTTVTVASGGSATFTVPANGSVALHVGQPAGGTGDAHADADPTVPRRSRSASTRRRRGARTSSSSVTARSWAAGTRRARSRCRRPPTRSGGRRVTLPGRHGRPVQVRAQGVERCGDLGVRGQPHRDGAGERGPHPDRHLAQLDRSRVPSPPSGTAPGPADGGGVERVEVCGATPSARLTGVQMLARKRRCASPPVLHWP